MKCRYLNCPNETCGDEYCYYHDKVINHGMRVYLTPEEQSIANLVYGRDKTPPWVGTLRFNDATFETDYLD